MITRTIMSGPLAGDYSLGYDAENRLVSVSGPNGFTASFIYDGDGQRVKEVINGVTTYFAGNYYEKTGSTITKYYYAGATRIAMQAGSTLTYLLGDHLGSTSVVTDSSGALLMETRYKPFGDVRYATAGQTLPTRYTFTGQYSYVSDEATDAAGFGLMYFGARFYDPWLGGFSSADTHIPDLGNAQSWDRYAFVYNNPIYYVDPTGHDPVSDFITGFIFEATRTVAWFSPKHQEALAVRADETAPMLAGRLAADITSIVVGGIFTTTGTGGAVTGATACAATAGGGCVLGGAALIAGGVVLAGEGVGMGVRGAEGIARLAAMSSNQQAGAARPPDIESIFDDPSALEGKAPADIKDMIDQAAANGWEIGTLGKGSRQGQGLMIREVVNGKYTGRIIEWHPGGGHHGPSPYWKISSPRTGTIRIGPQFQE